MTDRPTASTITDAQLDALYATNQRLNLRAQQLESELATYRHAVGQWDVSERGTYIPHDSLRAIGKAGGVDILGSVRHLKHFERVEQAEAALYRIREWADYHANQCEGWCCDHAPKLLALLDEQPAARRTK